MLEQAKEGLLAQASGYLSESLWVLVLEDSRELGSAVLPKSQMQSYESTMYNKIYVYQMYIIKDDLLTSLVGAGVGGSVGSGVGAAVVGAFVGKGVGCKINMEYK